jgi:hypothetical protein
MVRSLGKERGNSERCGTISGEDGLLFVEPGGFKMVSLCFDFTQPLRSNHGWERNAELLLLSWQHVRTGSNIVSANNVSAGNGAGLNPVDASAAGICTCRWNSSSTQLVRRAPSEDFIEVKTRPALPAQPSNGDEESHIFHLGRDSVAKICRAVDATYSTLPTKGLSSCCGS